MKPSKMRFHYGATDEKHIRQTIETQKKKPLDTFKFKLSPLLEGKQKRKLGETPIRFRTSPDSLVELCTPVLNAIPLPQPFKWRTIDVADWIRRLGFPQYQNTFTQNFINGRSLLRMNASNLARINIRNFEHIKIITASIRQLYNFDKSSFSKDQSMPGVTPDALYKFYRINTGPKYEKTRRTDLYRRVHFIGPQKLYETHWQTLERWLRHLQPTETYLIGLTEQKKYNLFYPQKCKSPAVVSKTKTECTCTAPPCTCEWTTERDLRSPWKLKYLANRPGIHKKSKSFSQSQPSRPLEIKFLIVNVPNKYGFDEDKPDDGYRRSDHRTASRISKVRFSNMYSANMYSMQ